MYPGLNGDSLQVFVSSDCGASWQKVYNKGGYALHTAPPTHIAFYPQSASEWKLESIPLEAYTGDVLIRFRSVCGFSNNLFLDDVKVTFPVGTTYDNLSENFSQYPNPVKNAVQITVNLKQDANISFELTNLLGQQLIIQDKGKVVAGPQHFTLDTGDLKPGVYLLTMWLNEQRYIRRMIVE